MNDSIRNWILKHQTNLPVVVAATLLLPKPLIMSFYSRNKNTGISWQGKKSCLTISFDCDYPRDVEALPMVLDTLKPFAFKTSFACVGHWIENYPSQHKMILEHGHEIMNHTYSHPDNELLNPGRKFRDISRQEKKEEVARCHEVCKKILGYEPTGCRIPHFKNLFTPEIYGILHELKYRYSSSTWLTNTPSNGLPFKTDCDILEFPLSTCPRHPFTVFDTWHSLESKRLFYRCIHRGEKAYLALLRRLIDIGIETNSYINIYLDPYDLTSMSGFKDILAYLGERSNEVWVAPYEEIIKTL
jgi:peptidoglycan-N-acetylglucosamine deacetylase